MPWFPDFYGAVELARKQTRAAGRADPVGQYFAALNNADTRALEAIWPGEVVVYDPRAGEVRGHRQLRRFVHRNQAWLAERHARTETVAAAPRTSTRRSAASTATNGKSHTRYWGDSTGASTRTAPTAARRA